MSCTIDMHDIYTKPQNCLTDLGYFNFTYSCKRDAISCNFDTDWCGWLHTANNTNKFRWEREQQNGYKKIPIRDHTAASLLGSYAYVYSEKSNTGDFAQLYLENIISMTEQCLSFWYYITEENYFFEVFKDDKSIGNVTRFNEQRWYYVKFPIKESVSVSTSQEMPLFNITIKVIKRRRDTDGAIAIDDILLANKACEDSLHECSFEDNACYASPISTGGGNYTWFRQKGESLYSNTGPKTDHTTGSVYGHYMYLDSYHGSAGDIACSQGPSVNVNKASCLTFWYHMYGTEVGRLNVTLNKNMIWSVNGDKGDYWNLAAIDIESLGYLTFEFIGIYGSGWLSDIAVDDILLLPGSCSGLIDYKKICVDLDYELHAETYCPKEYLDVADLNLSFTPEKKDDFCFRIYYQITTRLQTECENRTDSEKCLIDLSNDISSHPECFQLYEFGILYSCEEEETSTVSSDITSIGHSSTANVTTTVTVPSVINSRESDSPAGIPVYAVIALYTTVFAIVAGIVIIIKRCRKHRANNSKPSGTPLNIIVTKTIESSDCSNINNDKRTGVDIQKIKNTHDIETSIEQEYSICNKYESLSTNRNSVQHIYELDSTHTNQYESLTKQRESDRHTYESTEHTSPLDIKTSTSYQSLTKPPESDKHVYASTHTNQYESLSKQRESDKHTYESTEQALPVSMEQELSQYQSLTNPPESDKHVYASTHTNQYESLSKQRDSDKHTYESTEQALPVSMEQELSQYQSLTNPPESDKHVYASTHTNQYESLSIQRDSDKHTYESTEHALPVSKEQELSPYQSLTNPLESDKQVYASTAS